MLSPLIPSLSHPISLPPVPSFAAQVKMLGIIRDQLVHDYVEVPVAKPCLASRNSSMTLTDELTQR